MVYNPGLLFISINDRYLKSNIAFIVWFNLLNGIILYMTIATKMVDLFVSPPLAIPMSNVSFLFNGLETCFLFLNDWWQINAFKIPCLYFLLKEIKVEQSKIGDNLCVCVKKSSHDLFIMNKNSHSSLSKKQSYEMSRKFLNSYFDLHMTWF